MTDLEAIAKDAAERVHKNGGCVPQMAFAPILFALQDAFPTPVAETAGEADAWTNEAVEDLISDAIGDSMDMDWTYRDGAKAVLAALHKEGFLRFDLPPVPAQDDDKLRIAVEALEEATDEIRDLRRYVNNRGGMIDDEQANDWSARIAALKSTAALQQEG